MAANPLRCFVASIRNPAVVQRAAKAASTDSDDDAKSVISGCFVKYSSESGATDTLIRSATNDTAVYGFAIDSKHATTDEPYTQPFGNSHNVIDVKDVTFWVNLQTSATNPTLGTNYELTVTSGIPYLDTAASTNVFFRPIRLHPDDDADDDNPRYECEIVATRQ